jgi:F420H(2)-dependent quinone reductase
MVLAANGGQPTHLAWYTNLSANPRTSVRIGDRTRLMIAHTAQGDERARVRSRAVREYPAYERYQQKTSRQIPVVILRPAASVEGEDKAEQGQPTP